MSSNVARQTLRMDSGWRFHLGDLDAPLPNTHIAAYMANKAGWARGAAKPTYDDSDWRQVNLPHDWSVEGTFDPANHVNQGFLPRGIAWYRRHFQLDERDRGKHIAIQFDGVATHCTVYVNGHLLHRNFCGYTPFTIDISDVARFGDELNVIAARVDATYMEGWWYEGAGIYRHVWLIKTGKVRVATDGAFVCPVKESSCRWDTNVETTIENRSDVEVEGRLIGTLSRYAGRGEGEGRASATNSISSTARPSPLPSPGVPGEGGRGTNVEDVIRIPARATVVVHQSIPISNPDLWSIEQPILYQLRTKLSVEGRIIDDCVMTFGYRTIRFDPQEGFFLNDKPLKLLGTCNHQDHVGVGVAVPDSIHEFRIRRLKEMGTNAIRCAHNPPAPELLDACDRLGMLVIDENRNFGSSPQHLEQLAAMVKRDRNHPSIILWSICNEESIQGTPVAASIARAMQAHVKQLDSSRPVTAAVSGGILNEDCIASVMEVVGINYQPQLYDSFHAKHPNVPLLASETECALSTRSTYETDPEKHSFASYDEEKAFWGQTARHTWREVSKRRFVAGLFTWTGFDYRGEPSPDGWPCVSTHWGILDACGFEKDSFYLHKAFFTHEPFVHILPHWDWPGRDGQEIRVMVCTNCDEVEFQLNGESLGKKAADPVEVAEWRVKYQPGELKAVAFRENAARATTSRQTTGPAMTLGLEVHPSAAEPILADGEFAVPVTVFAMDAQGRRVPVADDQVTFSISGPGIILGVGNGDPTCHEPDKASSRSLFRGLAQVILQTTSEPGEIVLRATSPGLASAELKLTSLATTPRPAVAVARPRYFITDWRMSPITSHKPDANQQIADQDMNSWERIEPGRPQTAWQSTRGLAVYRAVFTPPRIIQSKGGTLRFHQIDGASELYVNGVKAASRADCGDVSIELAPSTRSITLSVLIKSQNPAAGLTGRVEILCNERDQPS